MSKIKTEESRLAKCPYYKCESRCVIFCEGVQAGSCIHLAFATPQEKRDYETRYCRRVWSGCMIAAGHNARWDWETPDMEPAGEPHR